MHIFTRRSLLLMLLLSLLTTSVQAQLSANFTASLTSGCAPLLVQFTSTSTGTNSNTTYSWNLGNSVTSSLQNPSTTYLASGTYTVSLTVSNGPGSSNTKTMTGFITVHPAPVVNFTGSPLAGCPPLPVQFSNQSSLQTPGAGTYSWDFGDGTSSTAQSPAHTYGVPGSYHITLTVTNSQGCSKTLMKPSFVEVYTPPVASFTSTNSFICKPPATVNFTNTTTGSGPFSSAWTFGDGGSSAAASPSHTYSNTGTYNVGLIVTDAHGCKDTLQQPGYVVYQHFSNGFTHTTVCEGVAVTFTDTTTGATLSSWDFGDGQTGSGSPVSHTYASSGTYNVQLITSNGSCLDTTTKQVTVNPAPVASFTASPLITCPAPATVQFTSSSTGATSHQWLFGDGGTSTATNPAHTYTYNHYDTVRLIVTNSFGCADTLVRPNYILIPDLQFAAYADKPNGCVPHTVNFSTAAPYTTVDSMVPPQIHAYPYGVTGYLWDFGDGSPASSQATPSHTYTAYGTYYPKVVIYTANGCTDTQTLVINVGHLPQASFVVQKDTLCINSEVTFINTSTGNITSYLWEFGDGETDMSMNPTHKYELGGTFTVTLHAVDNGCADTFMVEDLIHILPPQAIFGLNFSCDTLNKVNFMNMSYGATHQTWYFGDGSSSTAVSPAHIYNAPGNYTVILTTYNDSTGCRDTTDGVLPMISPQISFAANDTNICRHETITFTPTITGTNVLGYTWVVGGLYFFDTTASFDYTFNQNGRYDIKLIILDGHNCPDTVTRTDYITVAKPTAAFKASQTLGCVPMLVSLTDTSTNTQGVSQVSRYWEYGDGTTGTVTTAAVSHNYPFPGQYDVLLITTDEIGCSDTLLKEGYITTHKTEADFDADDPMACLGQQLHFINNSTGSGALSYQWDFGDGGSSTALSPTHTYTQLGQYDVRLIVTDSLGCADTLVKSGYVQITKPQASFTVTDTQFCPPLTVAFTNTSQSALSYSWDLGNGNLSSQNNPSTTYSAPGIFTVRMIATDAGGCTDTAWQQMRALGYAGALSYTPLIGCKPLSVTFTANINNVTSMVWDFSDGVTMPASGNTITHVYQSSGAFVPKLIINGGNGCQASSQGLDTIRVDEVYAGFSWAPPCERTAVTFQDTSTSLFSAISGWQWSFLHNSQTSTAQQPSIIYPAPGTYQVRLVATNTLGCKDTITQDVEIFALPIIEAGPDTVICLGDVAMLQPSGGLSYAWTPPQGLSCTNCTNPQATPTTPTRYIVAGTDANGCTNRDSVLVGLQTKTTSAVAEGGEICAGETFRLKGSGAQVYNWSPAAFLDNSQSASPLARPRQTTTFVLVATEGSCIPDTQRVRVVVHPNPDVDAGGDQTIVAGTPIMLQAIGVSAVRYRWTPSESLSCDSCSNPVASPERTTTYKVTAYTDFGCSDTDQVTIRVLCDQSQVFVPNTFTPNGDGYNDVFYPRGKGLKQIRTMRIYNRWGEVVFEQTNLDLNDKSRGWDGMWKGEPLRTGAFVYVIDALCDSGEPIMWKGDITLLR